MSIGTTIRVGWDASEVKSGFASLRAMFAGSIRGLRQVGIGAARQIGAGMTDLLGRAIMAVPEGIMEMMDWAGALNDMSAQTGVAVSKLALLEEALRMSGAEGDTSRMLSTLAKNLYDASTEMGPARDALHKLGFLASDFKGIKLDEAFEMIGKQAATMEWKVGELEGVMADLFGARMGYKLIRFFKDYSGNMKEAEKNTATFARHLDAKAASYDKMGDAMGRFKNRWRELMAIIVDQATAIFGDDFIDKAFDFLNPDRIRQTINWAREEIAGFFQGGGFSQLFRDLGTQIGDGLKESLRDILPDLSPQGIFRGLMGGKGGGESAAVRQLDEINAAIATGNRYLQKIETHRYGWA
jgi:hypothetical protein